MRRLPRTSALMALLGLLLPWARAVAVSAHVSRHHDSEAGQGVADLEESFHGHQHSQSDARHQHPLIGFDLVALRAKVIARVACPSSIQHVFALIDSASTAAVAGVRASVMSTHGPPGGRSQRAILRI